MSPKFRINNGVDVNAADKGGWTALHHAAISGHTPLAQLLLASRGRVDAFDKHGVTPLHLAARVGHADIVSLFLDNRADINRRNYPEPHRADHVRRLRPVPGR